MFIELAVTGIYVSCALAIVFGWIIFNFFILYAFIITLYLYIWPVMLIK